MPGSWDIKCDAFTWSYLYIYCFEVKQSEEQKTKIPRCTTFPV